MAAHHSLREHPRIPWHEDRGEGPMWTNNHANKLKNVELLKICHSRGGGGCLKNGYVRITEFLYVSFLYDYNYMIWKIDRDRVELQEFLVRS